MARRRTGLNALRAALGAIGGGLEGYGQMQEQAREQARRDMLDAAAMAERGWIPEEARAAQLRQAGPGLQSVLSSAASMMGGGAPKALDMPSLQQGAGMYGAPAGEITIGGRRLVLPETSRRAAAREAEFERGEARRQTQEERAYRRTTQREAQQEQIDALVATGVAPAEARAAVVAGYKVPQAPQPEWKQEGFASEGDYLRYLNRRAAAVRAPESARGKDIGRLVEEATIDFAKRPIRGVTGAERLPTSAEIADFRRNVRQALTDQEAPAPAPAAPAAPATSSLEAEYPALRDKIREARAKGYSDDAIRSYLQGRR